MPVACGYHLEQDQARAPEGRKKTLLNLWSNTFLISTEERKQAGLTKLVV